MEAKWKKRATFTESEYKWPHYRFKVSKTPKWNEVYRTNDHRVNPWEHQLSKKYERKRKSTVTKYKCPCPHKRFQRKKKKRGTQLTEKIFRVLNHARPNITQNTKARKEAPLQYPNVSEYIPNDVKLSRRTAMILYWTAVIVLTRVRTKNIQNT